MALAPNMHLLNEVDWEHSPAGPINQWSPEMRAVVDATLNSDLPASTWWGAEAIQIYNDSFNQVHGDKHPASFGVPAAQGCPDLWEYLAPYIQQVRTTRKPAWIRRVLFPMRRAGDPEECYFDLSLSPVRDSRGDVIGVISAAIERTTEAVRQRRLPLEQLSSRSVRNAAPSDVALALRELLQANPLDAALAVLYSTRPDNPQCVEVTWRLRCDAAVDDWLGPRMDSVSTGVQQLALSHGSRDPKWASFAHLVPIAGRAGDGIAVLALVPQHLVPIESHRRFAEQLSLRLHAALFVNERGKEEPAQEIRASEGPAMAAEELAAGVAHDFNNFLMVILGNLNALKDDVQLQKRERSLLCNALLAAKRAAGLTRQILKWPDRKALQPSPIFFYRFLQEISCLMTSTLGDRCSLQLDVPQDLPSCDLDVAQLTSALLNLAANARNAMPGGGVLQVRAQLRQVDVTNTAQEAYALRGGPYVSLCLQDSGVGIPSDQIKRIFEPSFTTKKERTGSGFGLPMVRSFVRQSGGDIRVTSEMGRGTQCELLFPIAGKSLLRRWDQRPA